MAFNAKEQEIIKWGLANGKTKEQVSEAITNYRTGVTPKAVDVPEKEPNVFSRVGSDIKGASDNVTSIIMGEGENANKSTIRRATEATAEAFNAVPKVAIDIAPSPIRKGLSWVGEKIGQGFKLMTDAVASTNLFKEIGDLEAQGYISPETAPEFYKLKDALGTASATGQIAGDVLIADQAANVAQKVTDVTKKTLTATKDVIDDASSMVGDKFVSMTNDTPSSIMQRVARISKDKQAKFESVAGESVGKYLTSRGIFGNIEEITAQLYKRFRESYQLADDELAKLKGTFDPAPVKTALDELVARETRVSTPGAPSPILARVQELASKKAWSMSEINEIKRLFERNVKVDYLKQNLPESVARATNLDTAIRNWQFKQAQTLGLKNLPAINKETQLAKQLMDALGKEYAGMAGNNAISLSDWIMLSGGDITAIAGFLVKKGFSSKSVQSAIAKVLNKGKGAKDIKADVGPSQVRELPAPTSNVRSLINDGSVMKVTPAGKVNVRGQY